MTRKLRHSFALSIDGCAVICLDMSAKYIFQLPSRRASGTNRAARGLAIKFPVLRLAARARAAVPRSCVAHGMRFGDSANAHTRVNCRYSLSARLCARRGYADTNTGRCPRLRRLLCHRQPPRYQLPRLHRYHPLTRQDQVLLQRRSRLPTLPRPPLHRLLCHRHRRRSRLLTPRHPFQIIKLYWTDYLTGKIQRTNLDGTEIEDLVMGLDAPEGIALDVSSGKMYWTNWRKIQRANLDGSAVEDLAMHLDRPRGIALDVSAGKMYWTDEARE